jgi:hypothetical protein
MSWVITGAPGTGDNLLYSQAGTPALDLRFASTKSLTDYVSGQNRVTFTRASSGTFVGSNGVLQTAANDVPRFDHNPATGESLGLLVEEARTNEVRSSSMTGGATGTPGTYPTGLSTNAIAAGLTLQIAALGTNEGLPYVDIRVSGTSSDSSGFSINLQPATDAVAASGQTWTGSCYCSLVAGSYSNTTAPRLRILERTLAGVYLAEGSGAIIIATGTSLLQARATVTRTLTNALTTRAQLGFVIGIASGVAVDFTLRFAAPQLELGAFASSYIPTTGTAVTRAADVASITGANFSSWYNQTEGTVFAAYDQPAVGCSIAVIDDGTTNNSIVLFSVSAANQRVSSNMLVASANQGRMDAGGTFTANVLNRAALAVSASGRGLSCNGSAVSTSANPSSMPSFSRLAIQGDNSFVAQKGGHLQRLTYWPQRLTNTTLQTITQP